MVNRMFPDLRGLLDTMGESGFKAPRAHRFGPTYVFPEEVGEAFLPADFEHQLFRNVSMGEPLKGLDGRNLSQGEKTAAAAVMQYLVAMSLYSGTTNYGRAAIGGDVVQRRTMLVDDFEREVLVYPQALPRFERTAETLTTLRMTEHPLAKNPVAIRVGTVELAELVTRDADFANAYLRTFMGGGPGSHGANRDDVLKGMFSIATLQFSVLAPYDLPRARKVVMESPQPLPNDQFADLKHTSRYMRRVEELHSASRTDRGLEHGVNDLVFRGMNDPLFVDAVYTNLVYCAPDPQREGGTVMAFPVPSKDNRFFYGMTATTLFSLLETVGDQYNIRPVRVQSAQELAQAVGYSGADPMQGALMEKVSGVLAPGTYKGPQWVDAWVTLDGQQKEFWSDGVVRTAAEGALQVYNDACWALNDGVLVRDQSLAADTRYCALFDVQEVLKGRTEPLEFRRAEYRRDERAA